MRAGRWLCVLVLLLAGCGGTEAPPKKAEPQPIAVVAHKRLDDRLEQWTLRTKALAQPTGVRVLLPARYRETKRRYPVLYLLHGAAADYRAWTRYGDAERITARTPAIVVMPDGGPDGWYTDWYIDDKPVQPRWETYHVEQLIPWIDDRYRTSDRAIAGLSMGGFGALSYAARHPGLFEAAASFSGALEVGSTAAWGPRGTRRWKEHLPIALAARLKSLKLLLLTTGDRGTLERFLRPSNVRLHRRLQHLGIEHVWRDRPGEHDWPYWRRDLRAALPALMRALAGG